MLPKLMVFAVSIVLMLAGFGWQGWQLWQVKSGHFLDKDALTIKATARTSDSPGLVQIASQHLLGNPADRPAAEPEKPEVLPATDLKFVLVGAITDTDPKKASALIQAEKDTKRYYVGEEIRGQAVLHEVSSNAVVLKRGNRLEILEFPKGGDINPEAREAIAKLTANKPPAQAAQPPANQQPTTSAAPQQSQPAKPAAAKEKPGRTLRDKLQKRPKVAQPPPAG